MAIYIVARKASALTGYLFELATGRFNVALHLGLFGRKQPCALLSARKKEKSEQNFEGKRSITRRHTDPQLTVRVVSS